ncbi:hypothetical protein GcC1_010031 [Golovinomyces cichoracearum]|uniref:Uncharacterized protein n=1 Tax=Golovinomyces cichoracearum TaxID=62708 RepID=A0A420J7Q8_9PEZI|nr:hypothetical protein GcC1_010031 [Golovinomyces cichoracearum]
MSPRCNSVEALAGAAVWRTKAAKSAAQSSQINMTSSIVETYTTRANLLEATTNDETGS